jgi:hypothetical protein
LLTFGVMYLYLYFKLWNRRKTSCYLLKRKRAVQLVSLTHAQNHAVSSIILAFAFCSIFVLRLSQLCCAFHCAVLSTLWKADSRETNNTTCLICASSCFINAFSPTDVHNQSVRCSSCSGLHNPDTWRKQNNSVLQTDLTSVSLVFSTDPWVQFSSV